MTDNTGPAPDDITDAWRSHRRVLLDVAYRLLGSVTEAEDAVSEAFIRLTRESIGDIRDVRGWLIVVVSRICLDQLGSARARRESYVGQWLPEPVVGAAPDADPAERITLDESVRMALLVVLERMSPSERVAFVLHDVFGYTFGEIGEIVGRTPASCRQLTSRARRRARAEGADTTATDPERGAAVTDRFVAACHSGDVAGLLTVLDPDVVLRADGGGHVPAPRRAVTGAQPILGIIAKSFERFPGSRMSAAVVNAGPGVLVYDGDTLITVLALRVDAHTDRITAIDLIGNPDKLTRVAQS